MRDLRLSFWASVYGSIGILLLLITRVLTYLSGAGWFAGQQWIQLANYVLVLLCLLCCLHALTLAIRAVSTLRGRRVYLLVTAGGLLFMLVYQLGLLALQFVTTVSLIEENRMVLFLVTLISQPTLIAVMSCYILRQIRWISSWIPRTLITACCIWFVARLLDKLVFPAAISSYSGAAYICKLIVSQNPHLSMAIYIVAFFGLVAYAVFCGKTVKKMPEQTDD